MLACRECESVGNSRQYNSIHTFRAASLLHKLEVIDIADGAGLPSRSHHCRHHLPARDQLHALMRERLEVLPPAGVGNGDRPGPVNAVELEAERAARALAGDV